MRKICALFLALALCLGTTLPALAQSGDAALADTVTIYTTNDLHGVVANSDASIGLAQIAGIKASTPNALLIDAGDATQGASFATVTQGADVIRMMNAAGYDAMAAGNHEFDYGVAQLKANADLADFPVLGCNLVGADGSPLLEEYANVEVGGHTVCFIGVTTTATETSTNPKLREDVTFADEAQATGDLIDAVKGDADAVVLVTHLGDNAAAVPCTSAQLLAALSEEQRAAVTAVIDGHSHTLENAPVNGIPVVQTGTLDTALGKLTLHFAADGTVTADEEVLDYAAAMAFPLNADGEAAAEKVEEELAAITAEQETVLNQTLCETATPLWGGYIYYDYAEPRIAETSYGDFVCDAFATYAEVFAGQQGMDRVPVIAVENGGGISAALPLGTVTQGDVLGAFNHGNMVEVLCVTPAQLYAALEAGLTMTGQDETGLLLRERVSGSFLQVSGFSYAYDPAGESCAKVTAVTLDDGTELARDDSMTELLLATNGYVAASSFADAEKLGELVGEDLLVASYLCEATDNGAAPLSRPTTAGRITIANDRSPETYTVAVPIEPVDGSSAAGLTVALRIDDGEEQEYTADGDGLVQLTLPKGPHTLYMAAAADGRPVYVNNYSGSGTVTTADGYYHLGFPYDAALTEPEPTPAPAEESEEPTPTPAPAEEAPAEQPMPAPLRGVLGGILVLAVVWVIVVLVRAARRKKEKQ